MLTKRHLHDVPDLFDLLIHPEVFPFVRHKAETSDEFYFITKQVIEAEENGELISRTIVNEALQPIGTINLLDIKDNYGFLATWIGQPYFGKGYNKVAKESFFNELFFHTHIQAVFMKIRSTNKRSIKAAEKLPYVEHAEENFPLLYADVNAGDIKYDLYVIKKEQYLAYQQFTPNAIVTDGEGVS